MKTVRVNTATPYDVLIDSGILADASKYLSKVISPRKTVIVSDDIVYALYGETLTSALVEAGYEVSNIVFPNGEQSKNMDTVMSILNAFSVSSLTRSDFAIALGGGVVGDITGFATGIYLRGIDFVQIPTTLLAAIDSSVGGKTGVNSDFGKNLIGTFHQPKLVLCDVDTFNSLPDDIVTAGKCEALKYGVIRDEALFDAMCDADFDISELVERCVTIKRNVVEADEFDHGERQLLNFGHTLGHSIEALSNFKISHGHAVGIGMYIITKAAEVHGLCVKNTLKRLEKALFSIYNMPKINYTAEQLYKVACSDKKRKGDKITLVVPRNIGNCFLYTIELEELLNFIKGGC